MATDVHIGSAGRRFPKEFNYLWVLFVSKRRIEWEEDRQIGAVPAAMWTLYQSIVAKRELRQKAKRSIYQSLCIPTHTYGNKLWVVSEIMATWLK